ncbi:hypothetical protein EVAR_30607_1 [Eumeta japonica]|uniref:Uncharacterized protein n=1 Tax=Eumeta variegata TaxID=151549 RepID=A0A4C1WAH8_EUMVA|nr:hypothetical protein EVAR_30607_1 [Eumeta japonica]
MKSFAYREAPSADSVVVADAGKSSHFGRGARSARPSRVTDGLIHFPTYNESSPSAMPSSYIGIEYLTERGLMEGSGAMEGPVGHWNSYSLDEK